MINNTLCQSKFNSLKITRGKGVHFQNKDYSVVKTFKAAVRSLFLFFLSEEEIDDGSADLAFNAVSGGGDSGGSGRFLFQFSNS